MNSQTRHCSGEVVNIQQMQFCWPGNTAPTIDIHALTLRQGEHLFIKGPSGCGKSTLLSLLTGINKVSQGEITVLGTPLSRLSGRQRDRFRADHLGYIFQQFNLLPYLSVIENVLLPCHFSAQRKHRIKGDPQQKARQLLTRLRLSASLLDKPVTELSIGQQQRVAAARALVGAPELIIADEPTSALDYDNRQAFIQLLLEESDRSGSTLIFVSHDPTLELLFKKSLSLPDLNRAGGTVCE